MDGRTDGWTDPSPVRSFGSGAGGRSEDPLRPRGAGTAPGQDATLRRRGWSRGHRTPPGSGAQGPGRAAPPAGGTGERQDTQTDAQPPPPPKTPPCPPPARQHACPCPCPSHPPRPRQERRAGSPALQHIPTHPRPRGSCADLARSAQGRTPPPMTHTYREEGDGAPARRCGPHAGGRGPKPKPSPPPPPAPPAAQRGCGRGSARPAALPLRGGGAGDRRR